MWTCQTPQLFSKELFCKCEHFKMQTKCTLKHVTNNGLESQVHNLSAKYLVYVKFSCSWTIKGEYPLKYFVLQAHIMGMDLQFLKNSRNISFHDGWEWDNVNQAFAWVIPARLVHHYNIAFINGFQAFVSDKQAREIWISTNRSSSAISKIVKILRN